METAAITSDGLEALLLRAVSAGWCVDINCSTCASTELREALGLAFREGGGLQLVPVSRANAVALVAALSAIQAPQGHEFKFEEAVRWVIYEVWRAHGDDLFHSLAGTWAGEALERMRSHHAAHQERRRLHRIRQGVKKRDWTE